MTSPSISIIVPTFQREKRLCDSVSALLEIGDPFLELLIIDQTAEHRPETEAFLRRLPPLARVIQLTIPNLPKARNIGVRHARGEIVLFLDDDIHPLPDLIEAHRKHYLDPTVGGVAGKLVSPYGEVKTLDPRYYTTPFRWRYIRFDQDWDLGEVDSAPGGNMSFRRNLLFEVGGFDENFIGNAFREETDLCIRLRNLGYRILFDPRAALIHYWKSEGGCDHIRLGNTGLTSFSYYSAFMHNNFYFFLKHVRGKAIGELVWELYRDHIGNLQNAKQGFNHVFLRHIAFCLGIRSGFKAWLRWRKSPAGIRFISLTESTTERC